MCFNFGVGRTKERKVCYSFEQMEEEQRKTKQKRKKKREREGERTTREGEKTKNFSFLSFVFREQAFLFLLFLLFFLSFSYFFRKMKTKSCISIQKYIKTYFAILQLEELREKYFTFIPFSFHRFLFILSFLFFFSSNPFFPLGSHLFHAGRTKTRKERNENKKEKKVKFFLPFG